MSSYRCIIMQCYFEYDKTPVSESVPIFYCKTKFNKPKKITIFEKYKTL